MSNIKFWTFVIAICGGLIYYYYSMAKEKNNFVDKRPNDSVRFLRLSEQTDFSGVGSSQQHPVHFIDELPGKIIDFPESYRPENRYYLISVDFTANYKTETEVGGRTGSALIGGLIAGPIGAALGASRKRKVTTTTTEERADAILILASLDLSQTYTITTRAKSNTINELKAHYLLNNIEVQNIQSNLEMEKQKSTSPSVRK